MPQAPTNTHSRYVVREIALPVDAVNGDSVAEMIALSKAVGHYLRVAEKSLSEFRILRKSLDARARNRPLWRYAVEFTSATPLRHPRLSPADSGVAQTPLASGQAREPLHGSSVAIVGSGPAGLAAAMGLVRKGYAVTVFEQGKPVGPRFRDIRLFIKQNVFDPTSNILFGEGGAGTFSDGKLTARTRNQYTEEFLRELVASGAEESILYLHHPHVGTDKLQFIVNAFRKHCEEAGVTFRFETEVTDLLMIEGRCSGVIVEGKALPFDVVVLAPGLSAHRLYEALVAKGVTLQRKEFSVGVRVEHPQDFINQRQLGDRVDARVTGAAEYFLTWQDETSGKTKSAFSFCMCPGGVTIPCADRPDALFTNGMSYSNRASAFANSAIVVPVDIAALPGGVLAGVEYQKRLEEEAFRMGGGGFAFPAQSISAFVENRLDEEPYPKTSFQKPLRWVDLRKLFEPTVMEALVESFRAFDRKLPGFIRQGVMIAPESRTSSPVRILRNPETMESVSTPGLYPIGEGAGYAGGIVSSGADGFRLADMVAPCSDVGSASILCHHAA
jgi:uncharacterized FAD-dependent dehydrogenase